MGHWDTNFELNSPPIIDNLYQLFNLLLGMNFDYILQ